ncbi:ABC transporter ATP-binding protein [Frigidibacter sp. ROC022]|uniref:ABC transporter ATP-binding protein n=1 Tax=Frigidibacter sp. ROC022 TaxID=2971796 RepID=UPI00215B3F67|nr:ABC transporter ATP-binding protein [Frigidibacter sp. ROC022]MCR8726722.1 ABC transporter ATP-binding protein [Frigidibacter sp. ROC022]
MSAVLEVSGLVKRFGGLVATDHVTLDVQAGEIHALIGPNGAGKSTLINQLSGEIAPDAGTIRLLGRDVTHEPAHARVRLGLGRTFQVTSLLDECTVSESVALAVQAHAGGNLKLWDRAANRTPVRTRTEALLAGTALEPRAAMRAADLSHGERKQLELVMALALEPKLMLLDEPMAGLGHVESGEMIEVLRGLRARAGVLLVEHDMDAVFALADRISVLVYGQIVASGSVEEIRENPEVRAAYLGGEDELC